MVGYENPENNNQAATGKFKGISFFITIYNSDGSLFTGSFDEPLTLKIKLNEPSTTETLYLYNTNTSKWEDAGMNFL